MCCIYRMLNCCVTRLRSFQEAKPRRLKMGNMSCGQRMGVEGVPVATLHLQQQYQQQQYTEYWTKRVQNHAAVCFMYDMITEVVLDVTHELRSRHDSHFTQSRKDPSKTFSRSSSSSRVTSFPAYPSMHLRQPL